MSARQNPFGHRSVRCKKHGVAYNPDLHSGCPLCRRSEERAEARRTGISTPFILVASAAVAAVSLLVMVGGEAARRELAAETARVQTAPETAPADPTPFRSQISTIERVLYQTQPPSAGDAPALRSALLELSAAAAEAGSEETDTLAIRSQAMAELLSDPLDLPSRRQEWERLRDAAFVPVGWFQKSTDQLAELQTPPATDPPSVTFARLEALAVQIGALIEAGEEEAIRVASTDSPPDVEGEEDPRRSWSRAWRDRVDAAIEGRPPTPDPDQSPDLFAAYERLRRAIEQLRMVPVDTVHGSPDQVARRFSRARDAVNEALETLTAQPPAPAAAESSTA